MKAIAVIVAGLLSTTAHAEVIDFAGQITKMDSYSINPQFAVGAKFSGKLVYGEQMSVLADGYAYTTAIWTATIEGVDGPLSLGNYYGQLRYDPNSFYAKGLSLINPGDSIGGGGALMGFSNTTFQLPADGLLSTDLLTDLLSPMTLQARKVLDDGSVRFASGSGFLILGVSSVPEPASWALMIGGIGLAGGMLRRQRATRVTYA